MTKFKWYIYPGDILVPDPANYQTEQELGAVLYASCYSRNGYFGCCWVCKMTKTTNNDTQPGYYIKAGSEDNGNMWKSPNVVWSTIGEAVAEAERLWRPA